MLMSGLRLSDLNKETTYLLTYFARFSVSVVFATLPVKAVIEDFTEGDRIDPEWRWPALY